MASPNAPLTPRESLARGCGLVVAWLLVVVLAFVFVITQQLARPSAAHRNGGSADAGHADADHTDAGYGDGGHAGGAHSDATDAAQEAAPTGAEVPGRTGTGTRGPTRRSADGRPTMR